MEIGKIDGFTIYILESLHEGDQRTGDNLRDDLRQYQYDNIDFPLNYEYHVIDDETALRSMLSAIEQVTSSTNNVPIIQLECHGNIDGIELSSYQHISWIDLFDLILNKIPGVFAPTPMGAFYAIAKLPVDDVEKFCAWCLTDFSYEGQTIMMAPATGFYTDPEDGRQQVRLAYVLNKEDLAKAMTVLAKALEEYNKK